MVKRGGDWEEILKNASQKARAHEIHHKHTIRKIVDTLKKLLTVELLIGLLAAFSLYKFYGTAELFKTLLNWTIGITLATTVVTFMVNRYKKLLHVRR